VGFNVILLLYLWVLMLTYYIIVFYSYLQRIAFYSYLEPIYEKLGFLESIHITTLGPWSDPHEEIARIPPQVGFNIIFVLYFWV
jgi:hypothetical protein